MHISGQHLAAVEEGAELEGEEEEGVKLLCVSGKPSAARSGSNVPQKKVKPAAAADDDDSDDEKAEEKASVKKFICNTPAKTAQKSNQSEQDSKPQN